MYIWVALKNKCEISKDIVDNYRTMFQSRISGGANEQLPCSKICVISSWSYDMEGHAKKCVERCFELANRTTQQFCEQNTFTRHIFSHLYATISMSDIGSSVVVCAFHLMCHLHFACCLILYDPPFCFPPSLSSSFFILFSFIFIFHVCWFDDKSHAHFRQ